jgi:hypothetical protein
MAASFKHLVVLMMEKRTALEDVVARRQMERALNKEAAEKEPKAPAP